MKYERGDETAIESVRGLAAILQRLADVEGQTYLLLTSIDPKREYRFCQPYGVPEDQASPWEKTSAARVIRPAGPAPTE